MSLPVSILDSAKYDLVSTRRKIISKFGDVVWLEVKKKFQDAFTRICEFPLLGLVPEEVEALGIKNVRQVQVNQTRVIYQISDTAVYIHMLVDTKRDFQTVLYDRVIKKF